MKIVSRHDVPRSFYYGQCRACNWRAFSASRAWIAIQQAVHTVTHAHFVIVSLTDVLETPLDHREFGTRTQDSGTK